MEDFGLNATPAIDLLREQLLKLLELARGGRADLSQTKIPFSVFLPDFGVNQASLTDDHLSALEELSEILLANPALEIDIIVGRASQTGNESNNLSLSEARAQTVLDRLVNLAIYPPAPIIGLGSSEPIVDLPSQEIELNRSVDIRMWYDLSYHAPIATDIKHPAGFWRAWSSGARYDRAALIVQLVYDNIDSLYSPIYDTSVGESIMNTATLRQDDALVRSRALLGYYKQTFSDSQAILDDIDAFNTLLDDNGLSPSNFSGEEISDAEHFFVGAVFGLIPAIGFGLGVGFSFLWDYAIQGSLGFIINRNYKSLKHNIEQFEGPDMAGVAYGTSRIGRDN